MKFEEFNFSLNTLYTDTMESKSTILPKEVIQHERIYRMIMAETQKTKESEIEFAMNAKWILC